MARNGSGTYSLPAGNPVVSGTTITSTWANTTLADIGTALTGSIAADGQTPITANLPMSGYKHTGVAVASALTDYARYDQVQNSAPQWLTSVSGTDTITASASPTPAAYAAGQTFRFVSAGANTGAVTLNVSGNGPKSVTKNGAASLSAGDIPSGAVVDVTYDGTQFQLKNATFAIDPGINEFRLTLTSGVPVTIADVTAATTIYCTPYKGAKIALYDGTTWNLRYSAEFSKGLGTLTASKPYDIFCYDNAGVPTLEFTAWTSDTVRATNLTRQNGVLVKSGDATRRYLGTFYTMSTTTTEDSEANRCLWNYYHRVPRSMKKQDATASWTYSSAAWRAANNSTTNRLNFVRGVAEDAVEAVVNIVGTSATAGNNPYPGICLDATNANYGSSIPIGVQVNNQIGSGTSTYRAIIAEGFHFLQWVEYQTSGAGTTYGTSPPAQSGIYATVYA